jgi:hypothetical protein
MLLGREQPLRGRVPAERLLGPPQNYNTARYVYEKSIRFTEEERLERERDLLTARLPEGEWDIIFHNGLMPLLTEALARHLSPWLQSWFRSVENPVSHQGSITPAGWRIRAAQVYDHPPTRTNP